MGHLPACPVVRMPRFHCWGWRSLPNQGAKISRAEQPKKKKITMDWSPFMPPKHHVNVSHESLPFTLMTHVKYVLGIFLFSRVQFRPPRTFVQHQLTIFLPASLPIIILGTSTSPWVGPLSPWPLSPSSLFSDLFILLQLT